MASIAAWLKDIREAETAVLKMRLDAMVTLRGGWPLFAKEFAGDGMLNLIPMMMDELERREKEESVIELTDEV